MTPFKNILLVKCRKVMQSVVLSSGSVLKISKYPGTHFLPWSFYICQPHLPAIIVVSWIPRSCSLRTGMFASCKVPCLNKSVIKHSYKHPKMSQSQSLTKRMWYFSAFFACWFPAKLTAETLWRQSSCAMPFASPVTSFTATIRCQSSAFQEGIGPNPLALCKPWRWKCLEIECKTHKSVPFGKKGLTNIRRNMALDRNLLLSRYWLELLLDLLDDIGQVRLQGMCLHGWKKPWSQA